MTSAMPNVDPLEVARGGVPRDRWDRAMLIPPGGGEREPYTAVSTLAKQLGSDFNLHRWDLRMTAKGVGMSRELAALAGSSRYDTRIGEEDEKRNREEGRILDDVVERAMELAGAHQKRDWGSAFHRYAEQDDPLGEPPEEMAFDLAAFQRTLKSIGAKIIDVEVFIVCEELKAAGSFDYLISVPWRPLPIIGDSKTGQLKLDQDEIQLAIYANGEIYDKDTDERRSFAEVYGQDVDTEFGLTLRTAACSREMIPYPLDLKLGFERARLAKAVHADQKECRDRLRKPAPLDVDGIGRGLAMEEMSRLEGLRVPFEDVRARLKAIHRQYKEVWTDDLSQYGGSILRAAKATWRTQ